MLVSNLMRNLNSNLYRMDKLQNQMATGRKFASISDDPSSLIYSQAARNKLARLEHYQRTVETAQDWLRQAEVGIMELQGVLVNTYEALVDATNDGKTDSDKQNIAQVVGQMREHFVDTLNATFGDKYVFSGYNTPGDPADGFGKEGIKTFTVVDGKLHFNGFDLSIFDGMPAELLAVNLDGSTPANAALSLENIILGLKDSAGVPLYATTNDFFQEYNDARGLLAPAVPGDPDPRLNMDKLVMMHSLKNDVLTFDVGPGVSMPVTMNGIDLVLFTSVDEEGNAIVRNAYNVLTDVVNGTNGVDGTPPLGAAELTKMIKPLQDGQNHLLTRNSEIGGRVRRMELFEARYEQDAINYKRMRSDAEDADMAEVITNIKMAEAVYQAALSAGARIIQPTLMDFLR